MNTYLQRRAAKSHAHRYFVRPDTNEATCQCGKVLGSKRAAPGQFNVISCRYNGYWYDSKFEASVAAGLDARMREGEIKKWDRQFTIELRDHQWKLIRRHKVDFRVHHLDGSYELLEAKGFETFDYKGLKRMIVDRWLPAHLDYSYTVVK